MAWTEQILILPFYLHVLNSVNFILKILRSFRFHPYSLRYEGGNKMHTYVLGGMGGVTKMEDNFFIFYHKAQNTGN